MTDNESLLLGFLEERSLTRGRFLLASGDTSDYYLDARLTTQWATWLIGVVLCERLERTVFGAIGGPATGSVPLSAAVSAVLGYRRKALPEGFWVRSEPKAHGTRNLIEGRLYRGARVVIVDDVITRGGSVMRAIEAVRDFGCEVVQVLTLIDRLAGAGELLRQAGVEFESIFTIRDFGIEP